MNHCYRLHGVDWIRSGRMRFGGNRTLLCGVDRPTTRCFRRGVGLLGALVGFGVASLDQLNLALIASRSL